MTVEIRYVPYPQIDLVKWDHSIDHAANGLVYGYSCYLDAMCLQWDALVMGDYEAVMPLTWNKKYGIAYLYQPAFTACLGVFGNKLTAEIVNAFLEKVPDSFRYWDISLNHGNFFSLAGFPLHQRMNYVLPLAASYETIYGNYRDNLKRNIKKSEQYGNTVQKQIPAEDVISLAERQLSQFGAAVSERDLSQFRKLYELLEEKGMATSYGVYGSSGQLLASCIFFFSHHRAYYILPGNHPDGKTIGASHALIDAFIKDHAAKGITLDFEGSDIPSLAFFYASFGAQEEKYSAIKLNKLPFWAKWLKK